MTSKLFSAVRETQPWGHPHHRGPEPALRPASPHRTWPLHPQEPLSLWALEVSPHGTPCQTSYKNPLLFPAPRYHQLLAPRSGAIITRPHHRPPPPPSLYQEPFLIHSPEAKHREPETHLPGWAPSGSSHPGETETCRSKGVTRGLAGGGSPLLCLVSWPHHPGG